MQADTNHQPPQYEPFGPVPWLSIVLCGFLSTLLAITLPIHTAYTLGLYNNYWEETYTVGAILSFAFSILGTVWTHKRVLLIDKKRVTALLFAYSMISVVTFIFLLHFRESQFAWIIPMWTAIHAIPLTCVSALRIGFGIVKPTRQIDEMG